MLGVNITVATCILFFFSVLLPLIGWYNSANFVRKMMRCTEPNLANPDVLTAPFGIGPMAPENCDVFSCGEAPLRPPLQGNEGCFVIACVPKQGTEPA